MNRVRRSITPFAALVLATSILMPAPSAGAASTDCFGLPPTILGTDGPDLLIGTSGPDVIQGLRGDDTIRGLEGDDVLCGGSGDDLMAGGAGDDVVDAGWGNDEITNSDPEILCSTSDDFSTVLTGSDALQACDPALGSYASAVAIPDATASGPRQKVFTMELPPGSIRDINVRVFITHENPCDAEIWLISPQLIQLPMSRNHCNGTQYAGTSFDSEAITEIAAPGTKDFASRFHGEGSLDNKLRNVPTCTATSCTWKLRVKDDVQNGQTGEISWWALDVNYPDPGADGADTVSCGGGNDDTLDYTARIDGVAVSMQDGLANDGAAGEGDDVGADDANKCEWLYSGLGDDVLTGNGAYNDIRAAQGDDEIHGGGGNDRFRGGSGDDLEFGDEGNDKLDGNDGFDTLNGGPGTDRCLNGESNANCEAFS